jgi:hypothetical protein
MTTYLDKEKILVKVKTIERNCRTDLKAVGDLKRGIERGEFDANIRVCDLSCRVGGIDDLTETDYGTLGLALGKCRILQEWIPKDGEFTMCILTKENAKKAAQQGLIIINLPFGFPDMTSEEYFALVGKLDNLEKIAWLKEQRRYAR